MTLKIWAIGALLVVAAYAALVAAVGFHEIGLGINFFRVTVAVTVLVIYVPALGTIFREVPPPNRDYLIAGIILTWTSGVCFAVWNEAGRIFHVTTSIFTSPVAGFFSLLLVLGGIFHLRAPYATSHRGRNVVAVVIGVVVGAALVFVAPLLKPT